MQACSTPPAAAGGDGGGSNSPIDRLTQLSSLQSDALIQYGARLIIVGEMLEALLASLLPAARDDVRAAFGERIRRVLNEPRASALPEIYHATIEAELKHFTDALR